MFSLNSDSSYGKLSMSVLEVIFFLSLIAKDKGGLNFEWLWSCINTVLQKVFAEDTAGLPLGLLLCLFHCMNLPGHGLK